MIQKMAQLMGSGHPVMRNWYYKGETDKFYIDNGELVYVIAEIRCITRWS